MAHRAGTVPEVALTVAVLGLWLLQGAVQRDYAPRDAYFWQYLYNTLYLMIGIPLSIGGSLLLALLLKQELPTGPLRQRLRLAAVCVLIGAALTGGVWLAGNANIALLIGLLWLMITLGLLGNVVAYRTMFYLPTFTAEVALMILWQALYNPETGPIDVALSAVIHQLHLHATPPKWLSDVAWAKPALIVMGVWISMGGTNMLLYLAALSNVPKELLEAASIDGADRWQQFWSVTWPQIPPTTFFISVMAVIGGLQGGFEQAQVMTQGGWGSGALAWFSQAKAAMIIIPRWYIVQLPYYPALSGALGAVTLPRVGNRPSSGMVSSRAAGINIKSPRRAAALEFLRYLASPQYGAVIVADGDGLPPDSRLAESGKMLANAQEGGPAFHQAVIDAVKNARPLDFSPYVDASETNRWIVEYQQKVENQLLTPVEAMRELAAQINEQIQLNLERRPDLQRLYRQQTGRRYAAAD